MRYKKSEEEPGERVGLFSIFPETLPYFRSKYPYASVSKPPYFRLEQLFSGDKWWKKQEQIPLSQTAQSPTLFHKREKSITNFLPFCLSKVGRIYSLYKLRSSPPPPAPPVPRPFKVFEPAITQGETFVNQNVAPLVRQMCDAWKVQGAKGFFFSYFLMEIRQSGATPWGKNWGHGLSHARYFGNGPLQSSGVEVRLVGVGPMEKTCIII